MWPITRPPAALLPVVTVLGIALRLFTIVALRLPPLTFDSTVWYLPQAAAIRAGHWLNTAPNGYPLVLAAIPGAIGSPAWVAGAQVLNVILAAVAGWCACRAARLTSAGEGAAVAVAAFVALWPHQVNYARYLVTEGPSAALLLIAVWAALTERPVISGLLAGLVGTMHTSLLPLCVLWPLAGLTFRGPRFAVRQGLASLVVVGTLVLAAYLSSGQSGLGANLAVNINIATSATHGTLRWNEPWDTVPGALRKYVEHAWAAPGWYLVQRLEAFNELWGPYPLEPARGVLARCVIGLRFPLFVLAVATLYRQRREAVTWMVAMPIVVVTIIHVLLFANARFAVPAEPMVALLTARWIPGRSGRPG